jgi:hypothetical protein
MSLMGDFPALNDSPKEVAYRANKIVMDKFSNESVAKARDYVAIFQTPEDRKRIAVGIFEEVFRLKGRGAFGSNEQDRTGRGLDTFLSAFPDQKQNILASALNNFCNGVNAQNTVRHAIQGILRRQQDQPDLNAFQNDLTKEGRKRFISMANEMLRDNQLGGLDCRLPDAAAVYLSKVINDYHQAKPQYGGADTSVKAEIYRPGFE